METKTEVKHTKLPWHCYHSDDAKYEIGQTFSVGGVLPTRTAIVPYDDSEGKANAAFIVKACNNHYQLVEATKEMFNRLAELGHIDPNHDDCQRWNKLLIENTLPV